MRTTFELSDVDVRKALQMYFDKFHNDHPDLSKMKLEVFDVDHGTWSSLDSIRLVDDYPQPHDPALEPRAN